MSKGHLDFAALAAEEVIEGLKKTYKKTVLPLEKDYQYDLYYKTPPLRDIDFEAKPLILVLGQYSVGKTSFIKHLIGRDFPGQDVGPEPTTDKFRCVYYGRDEHVVPGAVLQSNPDLPFREVSHFGNGFLNKFEGSCCASNALKSFTFMDTPGVLSGRKQIKRHYPYHGVIAYFANKASKILIMFDGNKLDISDEFKAVIKGLAPNSDKIRIILNKADSIKEKELIKVYGALMWGLGRVFSTPEVPKVYISSFGTEPLNPDNYLYNFFAGDAAKLIGELKSLPRTGAMQKVSMLVRRMRLVRLHAQIMTNLKAEMPTWFGRSKKQKQIMDNLEPEMDKIARITGVPKADFPNMDEFKEVLGNQDLSKYPVLNQRRFKMLEFALEKTIPALVKRLNDKAFSGEGDDGKFNPFSASPQEGDAQQRTDPIKQLEDQETVSRGAKSVASRASRPGRKNLALINSSGVARRARLPPSTKSVHNSSSQTNSPSQSPPPVPDHHSNQGDGSSSRSRGKSAAKPPVKLSTYEDILEDDIADGRSFYDYREKGTVALPTSDGNNEWVVSMTEKSESDSVFYQQRLINNKLTGSAAKRAFAKMKLPNTVLLKIWQLVDFEGKNELDSDQFALALWLARKTREGEAVPEKLTWQMVPPSYREK